MLWDLNKLQSQYDAFKSSTSIDICSNSMCENTNAVKSRLRSVGMTSIAPSSVMQRGDSPVRHYVDDGGVFMTSVSRNFEHSVVADPIISNHKLQPKPQTQGNPRGRKKVIKHPSAIKDGTHTNEQNNSLASREISVGSSNN